MKCGSYRVMKWGTRILVFFFAFSLNAQPCINKLDNMNVKPDLPPGKLNVYINCVTELRNEVKSIQDIGGTITNLTKDINSKKEDIRTADESKKIIQLQKEIDHLENIITDIVNNTEITNYRRQQTIKKEKIESLKNSPKLKVLNNELMELENELVKAKAQKKKIITLDTSYCRLIRYFNEDEDGENEEKYFDLKTELKKSFKNLQPCQ